MLNCINISTRFINLHEFITMKNLLLALILFSGLMFGGCGAGSDALDVCNCYKEVYSLEDEKEVEEKMNECITLLGEYQKKHSEAGTLEEFTEALNKCR